MRNTAKASLVMSRAWAEARHGQTIYGGPVRCYMAEALRIVWAELNVDPVMRAADELIAQIRANRSKAVHVPPYCVRNRGGYRAITRWYAGQGARA